MTDNRLYTFYLMGIKKYPYYVCYITNMLYICSVIKR